MREDQIQRMRDLAEKLAEVVLEEADPENWPGAGRPSRDMTQQERGDRYWCMKIAAASYSLLERTMRTVADASEVNPLGHQNDRPELDQEIARLERAAAKKMVEVVGAAQKAAGGRA